MKRYRFKCPGQFIPVSTGKGRWRDVIKQCYIVARPDCVINFVIRSQKYHVVFPNMAQRVWRRHSWRGKNLPGKPTEITKSSSATAVLQLPERFQSWMIQKYYEWRIFVRFRIFWTTASRFVLIFIIAGKPRAPNQNNNIYYTSEWRVTC